MKNLVFVALFGAMLVFNSFTVAKGDVKTMMKESLNYAVDQKLITETERKQLVESGIVDVACETFFRTKGDVKATVNAVADRLVEQGYFSSRSEAKRVAKTMIERARKDEALVKKMYSILGI